MATTMLTDEECAAAFAASPNRSETMLGKWVSWCNECACAVERDPVKESRLIHIPAGHMVLYREHGRPPTYTQIPVFGPHGASMANVSPTECSQVAGMLGFGVPDVDFDRVRVVPPKFVRELLDSVKAAFAPLQDWTATADREAREAFDSGKTAIPYGTALKGERETISWAIACDACDFTHVFDANVDTLERYHLAHIARGHHVLLDANDGRMEVIAIIASEPGPVEEPVNVSSWAADPAMLPSYVVVHDGTIIHYCQADGCGCSFIHDDSNIDPREWAIEHIDTGGLVFHAWRTPARPA